MDSDYLIYNFVNIEDSLKPNYSFSKDKNSCINICSSETNCQGVNISKPICGSGSESESENENVSTNTITNTNTNTNTSNNIGNECIKSNLGNGISSIEPENLKNYNCNFLTNINPTNYVTNSENNYSFIKKQYGNNLNNISLNKKYYLKINNMYIGIDYKQNQIFLVNTNDISLASVFQFNKNGNIIETKTNKCIQINGDYLILEDCIQDNVFQEFIYENKSNTIRPNSNNLENNICFSLDFGNQNGTNNIVLEECNYSNNINQLVEVEVKVELEANTNNNKENFVINDNNLNDLNDLNDLKKINYCSNPVYKTIVTFILCCILIYFIWYLTRKKYNNDGIIDSDLSVGTTIIN